MSNEADIHLQSETYANPRRMDNYVSTWTMTGLGVEAQSRRPYSSVRILDNEPPPAYLPVEINVVDEDGNRTYTTTKWITDIQNLEKVIVIIREEKPIQPLTNVEKKETIENIREVAAELDIPRKRRYPPGIDTRAKSPNKRVVKFKKIGEIYETKKKGVRKSKK